MSLVIPGKGRTTSLDEYGQRIRSMLGTATPPNAAIPPSMQGTQWFRQPDGSYGPSPAGSRPKPAAQPQQELRSLPRPSINGLPNPAYGEMYGLEWDGRQWVKANPNADLERELMELELEKRRKEVNSSGQADQLRAWLAKRLGSVE